MFNTITTSRYVWDIYAEIAAAKYAKSGSHPENAAKSAAMFADQMSSSVQRDPRNQRRTNERPDSYRMTPQEIIESYQRNGFTPVANSDENDMPGSAGYPLNIISWDRASLLSSCRRLVGGTFRG